MSVDSVGNGRYLVLYVPVPGTTEKVARQISTTLHCDILEVEPATAYEGDYNAMLDPGSEELAAIVGGITRLRTSVWALTSMSYFYGYPTCM